MRPAQKKAAADRWAARASEASRDRRRRERPTWNGPRLALNWRHARLEGK